MNRSRHAGFVLFTVLITLAVMASIILLISYSSSIGADAPARHVEADRADYLARAAMQHAVWMNQNAACVGDMTLPAGSLGGDSYSASISGAGTTSRISANIDQDAWIRSDDVTRNNGSAVDQHIRNESGNIEHALFQFDLSGVAPNARVNSATAWFFVESGGEHPEGAVTLHRLTDAWTESTATWETMNSKFDPSIIATIPPQPAPGVWIAVNLTGQVQAWVNGQPNFGVLLASAAEGVHAEYHSSENGTSPPRLDIVVGSAAASPVAISATGTLANGNARTLLNPEARAYQPMSTLVLQPGTADGVDAYIWGFSKTSNYGNDDETWVATGNNNEALALFRFDLDAIPANSRIISATLSVHHRNGSDPNVPVSAHRIARDWNENEVTWNRRKSGEDWSTPGGDFDAGVVSSTDVGPGVNTRYEWDLSSLVQEWKDGARPNYGVLLRTEAPGIFGERFDTSDHADPQRHPRLTVSYACECGQSCLTPLGAAGNILMVIGSSPFNPGAFDKALRARLESWGYTVTLIQDDDSSGNYNAGIAANDVVLVAESVDSNNVGTKLTGAAIGVVNTEGALNDELGIASASATTILSDVTLTDTSHFITAIFTPGALAIYASGMEAMTTSGTVATGAQRLAESAGGAALLTLDVGADLFGGGTAAGRRVMLPFGRWASIDFDYIGSAGWLLLHRSLAWSMGMGASAGGNVLLVVADANVLSAQEVAKRALMESWGFSVSLIDDGASQGEFDAAVALADIAYVAEDIGAGALGTKLREAPIGVVIEEEKITDEFGISSGEMTFTEASVDIIDNAHYITQPFSLGTVTFSTLAQPVGGRAGTLAPGLAVLARRPSSTTSMLDVIDTGGLLFDTGTALGRRVKLPWGGNDFDINALTADGLTIMQRSLQWAGGMGCGALQPLALIVDDAANPGKAEIARRDLIQSWCYDVTLMTAAEPLEVYEKVANNVDVFYVSSTVNYADVTSKLKPQPAGVVNEVSTLSAYLGFTSGTGGFTGSSTTITDEEHEITAPFGAGDLTITSSSQSLHRLVNTIGPGLHTLSTRNVGGDRMLMTLSRGDELLWGGIAAGRRVMLPWGGSAFDINALTADGELLMRRSIDWASKQDVLAPVAHWKLDETSGTSAIDSAGGHDGTLTNGPAWNTGPVDGALNFDGNNDYINVPHDDSLSLQDAMSFSAWINASSFGATYQTILAKDAGGAGSNYWFGTWQNELVFGFFSSGFFREVFTADFNLQAGAWYHVAASFDNTSKAVTLYVDGAQVRTGFINFTPTLVSSDLRIGRSPDGEHWRGLLDDVRIYEEIVPVEHFAALHAEGASPLTGGGGGVDGGSCNGSYRDEFSAVAFDGSDGSLDWRPTPWAEVGESDGAGSGDVQIKIDSTAGEPAFSLQIQDNDNGGEGVERLVNLAGAGSVSLNLRYRREALDNGNDYVALFASSNGLAGPWTELPPPRIAGGGTDSAYVTLTRDLSDYAVADAAIRLRSSNRLGNNDRVFFGDIEIVCTP